MQNIDFKLIQLTMITVCVSLLSPSGILGIRRGETVNSKLESQGRTANADSEAYEEWYRVFEKGEPTAVINASDAFLEKYPYTKYSGSVQEVRELAKFCVEINADVSTKKAAESLRFAVKASLVNNADELKTLLKQILNRETTVNARSSNGATALMFAALTGDGASLRALTKERADVNAKEETHGWSALIYAVWSGDPYFVHYLLEFHADVTIKDKEGKTMWDHAKAAANFRTMSFIYSALTKAGMRPDLK